jgi:chromosome segregation ATPase
MNEQELSQYVENKTRTVEDFDRQLRELTAAKAQAEAELARAQRKLEALWAEQDEQDEDYHDDLDGDHGSALASAGWGTDEDYGCYGGEDY